MHKNSGYGLEYPGKPYQYRCALKQRLHLVAALFGAPKAVRYYAIRAANGVDISGTAILEYEGFHALCTGSKDSTSPSGVILQGEEGYGDKCLQCKEFMKALSP